MIITQNNLIFKNKNKRKLKSFTQRFHVAMMKWTNKLDNKGNMFAPMKRKLNILNSIFQMDAYCQNLSNSFIIKFVLRENLSENVGTVEESVLL